MKINWRVLIALVVIAATVYVTVDSLRSHSYAGSNLTFPLGSGAITITNPSTQPITAQLVGVGTRSFTVSSADANISGPATRQGTGNATKVLFEFQLPAGVSIFSVAHSGDVNFVASTDTRLESTTQPMSDSAARTTQIAGTLVVLGALYYMSRSLQHRWIGILRHKLMPGQLLTPLADKPA